MAVAIPSPCSSHRDRTWRPRRQHRRPPGQTRRPCGLPPVRGAPARAGPDNRASRRMPGESRRRGTPKTVCTPSWTRHSQIICAPVRLGMVASLPDGKHISQIDSYSMTINNHDTRLRQPGGGCRTNAARRRTSQLVRSLPHGLFKERMPMKTSWTAATLLCTAFLVGCSGSTPENTQNFEQNALAAPADPSTPPVTESAPVAQGPSSAQDRSAPTIRREPAARPAATTRPAPAPSQLQTAASAAPPAAAPAPSRPRFREVTAPANSSLSLELMTALHLRRRKSKIRPRSPSGASHG